MLRWRYNCYGNWFANDGYSWLFVYAGNGPSPDPSLGSSGNVTGDGSGYWIGLNSQNKDITVGSGDDGCRMRPRPTPHETTLKLRETYPCIAKSEE